MSWGILEEEFLCLTTSSSGATLCCSVSGLTLMLVLLCCCHITRLLLSVVAAESQVLLLVTALTTLSSTLQCGLRPSRHQHWAEQGRADWATPAMSPPPVTTDIRGLWGQTSAFMGRGSVKRQQSDNPDDHV